MEISESLTVSVGTCLADLVPLEREWKALLEVCVDATPFQSPGWLLSYLRAFRPAPLKVLLIRRNQQLSALFPFVLDNSGGHKILKLLGLGVSDYLDGLCRAEDLPEVCKLVEHWLADELEHCDCAEFNQLRQGALLKSIPGPNVFHEAACPAIACPVVSLRSTRHGTVPSLPQPMKRYTLSSLRRLKKLGGIRLELANEDSFDMAVSNLFLLHTKRWQRRDKSGVFDWPEKQTFYRQAFGALKKVSAIDLFTLYLQNVPIAALAAFRKDRVLYYYIGGFDPDYSRFSPGNLIVMYAMEFAIKTGCDSFDFLRGREPYKYKWGAQDQETFTRRIWSK
jgi:CelD/BcsL family acetyltransferase involved in cellulose biosynthesis